LKTLPFTLAVLGHLYKMASSPKTLPGPIWPSIAPSFNTFTLPSFRKVKINFLVKQSWTMTDFSATKGQYMQINQKLLKNKTQPNKRFCNLANNCKQLQTRPCARVNLCPGGFSCCIKLDGLSNLKYCWNFLGKSAGCTWKATRSWPVDWDTEAEVLLRDKGLQTVAIYPS